MEILYNIDLLYEPMILMQEMKICNHTKKKYVYVHGNIIHNSQKEKTTLMSINWWMNKQNIVYPHNGLFFDNKKEWNADTCYNLDEPWKHYVKYNIKSQWTIHFMISIISKSIETRRASHVVLWKRTCLPMQETWETWVQSLGLEDPLEEGMATHSSILAWRIPWTEKPGGP